jgi:choline dehydrogenase
MEAEYVVVGAGSGGSAVAFRLAEAGRSVIVVEHGGSDAGPLISMPGALSYPMNMARYDWGYRTEPEPGLGGRQLAAPRGKVVGGSSSINGMVWVRGHPLDYAAWEAAGARGWGWRHVAPYFRRIEAWDGPPDGGVRGRDGPVRIRRAEPSDPLGAAFLQAGVEAGHGLTEDYNGRVQEGVCRLDATIHQGARWSAARAYLRPARRLGARLVRGLVTGVAFDGRRATGVRLAGGRTIRAGREVILAASAFNTPKLLLLSGIGPGSDLQTLGLPVVANRPGVGRNLQDHLEVYVRVFAPGVGLFRHWSPWGKAMVGARWALTRAGPGASNQLEVGAFLRSAPDVDYPDVQFHFLPLAVRYDGRGARSGFQIHAGPMRSRARGHVRLAGPDPAAPPEIRFGYMTHEDDAAEFRATIRLARRILLQPAFAPCRGGPPLPGGSDEEIDAYVRDHAESAYHPCGTATMGDPDDPMAVADPEGRVVGVEGLRVADSSAIPRITNGNLNAPSILIGEKVAAHILGRDLAAD